jgi:hypothetical protein
MSIENRAPDLDPVVKATIQSMLTDPSSPIDFGVGNELILIARRVREGFLVEYRFLLPDDDGRIETKVASSFVREPAAPPRRVQIAHADPADRIKRLEN